MSSILRLITNCSFLPFLTMGDFRTFWFPGLSSSRSSAAMYLINASASLSLTSSFNHNIQTVPRPASHLCIPPYSCLFLLSRLIGIWCSALWSSVRLSLCQSIFLFRRFVYSLGSPPFHTITMLPGRVPGNLRYGLLSRQPRPADEISLKPCKI